MGFRFYIVVFLFAAAYLALGGRLYFLQITKGEGYISRAGILEAIREKRDLRRGQIYFTDRENKEIPVALNRDYPVVFASPKEITDVPEAAETLSPILGLPASELASLLKANSDRSFLELLPKPTSEQVDAIRQANLKGIHIESKQYRNYPYGRLGAHMIGYLGQNAETTQPVGLYGIEKSMNEKLSTGEILQMTIDRTLQSHAEEVLARLMKDERAAGGTIMITEPKTGKILAMASAPDFDPNSYQEFPIKNFLNPAVQLQYEPGSVFKPLTMAAGIDSGALTPETTYVDTGSVTLNGKTITNWDHKAYGKTTMTGVIEHSINTGAVFAEQQIGNETFKTYLRKFGLGVKTNIDLPDEVTGSLRNLDRKEVRQIDFATASYGQGTAVTPVQLVAAFGALANGGVLMRPFVMEDTGDYVVGRVIREDTAQKVTAMMESAVEVNRLAAIPGYRIAGKTGTAFVPNLVRGGYYDDQFIHTFVGFGPVSDPKFLVYMKLDKPQVNMLAGGTVVPVFRDVAEFILNYYSIPPDKLATTTPSMANQ